MVERAGTRSDARRASDLWPALAAAGPKAIAEALDPGELERLHVETGLEAFIASKVAAGFSVVLTGNAGDGKTHALRRTAAALEAAGAVVVADATAAMVSGDVRPVLDAWRAAAGRGRPFCVAANEFPLYQMRSALPSFPQVEEVARQCRERLAYGRPRDGEAALCDVLVIDLSLRNPLGASFFGPMLDRVLADAARVDDAASAASRNHALASDRRVRTRLCTLMDRMVSLGHRATVRELWILAARMVYGRGAPGGYARADWYSDALFAVDSRFDLTRALRDVDPAFCSHPYWDAQLEVNAPALRAGWMAGIPAVSPHPELDAEAFSALKRRFYFEHEDGERATELADPDADGFRRLLSGRRTAGRRVVEELVDAVNAAYCPVRFGGRGHHLYLWTGHRFHEQPSRSFVAADRLGVDGFAVDVPRLPSRLEGCFRYEPDHIALTATTGGRDVRLRIDFPLFRTLRRLSRGLPRKLVPERDIHRLDTFLERLAATAPGARETVWSVNLEAMEVIQVGLSPDGRRYEGVRRHA